LLDNYIVRGDKKVTCPRCGSIGYLTNRWVRSSYYPYHQSIDIDYFEGARRRLSKEPNDTYSQSIVYELGKRIKGTQYQGEPKKHFIDYNPQTSSSFYRISSEKYYHWYVGHYSGKKYQEQMRRYKNQGRRSRPNGRKWCSLREGSDYVIRLLDSELWFIMRKYQMEKFFRITIVDEVEYNEFDEY
jgi:hypothetical protein